jgi:hypothetical protein
MQAPFPEGLCRYGRGQEREDVGDGEADQEGLLYTFCNHITHARVHPRAFTIECMHSDSRVRFYA